MSGQLPFGFGMGDGEERGQSGQPFDLSSLGAMLSQLGAMLQGGGAPDDGKPVQWTAVHDTARGQLAAAGDPSVADAQRRAVDDAVRLADLWLDDATTFPGTARAVAWSRAEWIEQTLPAWQRYVEPVAESMQQLTTMMPGGTDLATVNPDELLAQLPASMRDMFPDGLPPQLLQMMGPMMQMASRMGAMAFSAQLGQALAALAQEVLGSADIGIPLTQSGDVALVPVNIEAFGDGLELPRSEVLVYLAMRESAHQRLFAHVPWLRARLVGAIEAYARGVRLDTSRIEEIAGSIDPSNPQALQDLLAGGVLQPEDTPEQAAAIARLQVMLALIEGWVDDVVTTAAADRLTAAPALQEALRRRRAAGGPAEKTFGTLVGMDLRPRAMREAAAVFAALRATGSAAERDALWAHPDLLPTAEDLEDPLGFVEHSRQSPDDLGSIENG